MAKGHEVWKEEVGKPLREWLLENHARCNWSEPIENVGTVSGYVVNGRLFVVLDFKNGGWEAFTAVDDQNIEAALCELAAACGL